MAEFTEAVQAIVDLKLDRLESVPANFFSSMAQIEKDSLNKVLRLLDELDYTNGKVAVTAENLRRVEALTDAMRGVLTGPEYEASVSGLLKEMDVQAGLTYQYFEATVDKLTIPKIADEILKQKKRLTVESLLNMTDERLSVQMRTTLSNAVAGGSSRQGLIDTVRLLVVGSDTQDGRLLSATRQIVSDTFALADSAVTNAVADELGLDWYLYTGGLIDTTRPFCKQRLGGYFHRTEVESWAAQDWDGKMAGTTSQTIFVTRGGYNCQHAILPVSEAVVPLAVRNRIK